MKKLFLLITMLLSFYCLQAQQLPPYDRSRQNQVLADRATISRYYMGVPHGQVPFFPSYVPDSLKCGALFDVTPGIMDPGLYRYNCQTPAWEKVGTAGINNQTSVSQDASFWIGGSGTFGDTDYQNFTQLSPGQVSMRVSHPGDGANAYNLSISPSQVILIDSLGSRLTIDAQETYDTTFIKSDRPLVFKSDGPNFHVKLNVAPVDDNDLVRKIDISGIVAPTYGDGLTFDAVHTTLNAGGIYKNNLLYFNYNNKIYEVGTLDTLSDKGSALVVSRSAASLLTTKSNIKAYLVQTNNDVGAQIGYKSSSGGTGKYFTVDSAKAVYSDNDTYNTMRYAGNYHIVDGLSIPDMTQVDSAITAHASTGYHVADGITLSGDTLKQGGSLIHDVSTDAGTKLWKMVSSGGSTSLNLSFGRVGSTISNTTSSAQGTMIVNGNFAGKSTDVASSDQYGFVTQAQSLLFTYIDGSNSKQTFFAIGHGGLTTYRNDYGKFIELSGYNDALADVNSVMSKKYIDSLHTLSAILASANTFTGGVQTNQMTALATTVTDGFILKNSTLSTSGAVNQYAPSFMFSNHVWNTTSVAADNFADYRIWTTTASGTSPKVILNFGHRISTGGSGSFVTDMTLDNLLNLSLTNGQISTFNFVAQNAITTPHVRGGGLLTLNDNQADFTTAGDILSINNTTNVKNTSGFVNGVSIYSNLGAFAGSYRALYIPMFVNGNTGTKYFADFVTSTSTNGGGTITHQFNIDQSGNTFGTSFRPIVLTFSTLPTGVTGMIAAISDSTITSSLPGTVVTGGGSNYNIVTYNGTNWVVL